MATTESRTEARSGWSTETDSAEFPAETGVLDSTEAPEQAGDEPAGESSLETGDQPGIEAESGLEAEGMADVEARAEAESAVDGNLTMETETSAEGIAEAAAQDDAAVEAPAESSTRGRSSSTDTTRRPNTFLADLTRAMHTAAEAARATTISQYQADAKAFIEQIHGSSSSDVTEFRQQADDDIAAIRDWSKAEIARIREETEKRISARKAQLDDDLEGHAAYIERQIERVQGRITAFEGEMGQFFERLLGEQDPTKFAALAQNLPEPPPFDSPEPTRSRANVTKATQEPHASDEAQATYGPQATEDAGEQVGEVSEAEGAAAALAARFESGSDTGESDFAAAEAEAAAAAATGEAAEEGENADGDDIPVMADDALAARLAGLIPVRPEGEGPADGLGHASETKEPAKRTQLVVVGLVSVASIASFKRHLGRVEGVSSVGVSSGPDGEFLFTVGHQESVSLRDAVQGLPGFQARITNEGEGVLNVSAHDPESDG
jgi:hypothetical protein